MARACAAQTKSTFLKLAGPQLVQMFIGDGAKLVRDAFALAKEKAPAIIFIDELDAIGTKRFDSEKAGDREVQRTMLELLNQVKFEKLPTFTYIREKFLNLCLKFLYSWTVLAQPQTLKSLLPLTE